MAACAECGHFRRVRPASQLLAAAVSTNDAKVSDALTKIVEDEGRQRSAEAEYKRAEYSADRNTWVSRPVMTEYCGLLEAQGQYLIAEVKNRAGDCADFTSTKPTRQACSDCVHRVPASGPAADAELEEQYTRMAATNLAVQLPTSQPDALLNSHREGTAAKKALEISGAYAAKGHLPGKPRYLDHCAHFSTEDDFVACTLQNPHHTCPSHTRASDPAVGTPADPPLATPPPTILRSPTMGSPTSDLTSDVLADGPAPLTRAMVAATQEYISWLLGIQLPADAQSVVADEIVRSFTNGDAEAVQVVQSWVAARDQLRTLDHAAQAYARESNQPQFVAMLRQQTGEFSRRLLQLYDAANQPLASGDPPLTREVAETSVDLFRFMSAAVRGEPFTPAPRELHATWTRQLIDAWPTMSPQVRDYYADAPRLLAEVYATWDKLTADLKDAARRNWSQQIDVAIAPALDQEPSVFGRLPAANPPAVAPVAPTSAPITGTSSQRSVDDLLADILAKQEEDYARLEKVNPELALQQRLMTSQQNTQMLSNIAKWGHDNAMAVIKNMVS